jgi:hypothetical protein
VSANYLANAAAAVIAGIIAGILLRPLVDRIRRTPDGH